MGYSYHRKILLSLKTLQRVLVCLKQYCFVTASDAHNSMVSSEVKEGIPFNIYQKKKKKRNMDPKCDSLLVQFSYIIFIYFLIMIPISIM